MSIMHKMRKRNSDKQISDSLRGEQFVLVFVAHSDGNVIPSDISAEMGISTARIAATLNSLESKGLITRRIDVNDRRKILVELTDAGRAKEAEHTNAIMRVMTRMLENLGEKDATEFLRILKKIAEHPPEEYFEDDMQ